MDTTTRIQTSKQLKKETKLRITAFKMENGAYLCVPLVEGLNHLVAVLLSSSSTFGELIGPWLENQSDFIYKRKGEKSFEF